MFKFGFNLVGLFFCVFKYFFQIQDGLNMTKAVFIIHVIL